MHITTLIVIKFSFLATFIFSIKNCKMCAQVSQKSWYIGWQNKNPSTKASQQWVHIDISAIAYNDHLVGDYFHYSKTYLINTFGI